MENRALVKEIRSWIFSILIAFCLAILINSKVSAKVLVQQNSMENTLFNNQQLIIDKLSYNFSEPERGDIIIFLEGEKRGGIIDNALGAIESISSLFNNDDTKGKDNRLVKRVIGVSGDEVDIKEGYVYLNGERLEEPYVKGETFSGELNLPVKIGDNKLFVLGDNRMVSRDSREFGLIDINQVEGKAIFRIYPFNQMGRITQP